MDPVSIAAIGIGSSVAGGLTSAGGALASGKAAQQMAQYQAGVAQINASISKQNADYARDQGERQAEQAGLKEGQQMGQIRAAQASSGLDINSGSAKQVQDSQRLVAGMDQNQIRANAAKTAYNFDVQSVSYENQANIDLAGGQNAAAAASINADASILGTVSSVSSKWLQGSQVGLGTSSNSGNGIGALSLNSSLGW